MCEKLPAYWRKLLYVGGESDDKEEARPKSRDKYHAKYHEGKGTYTDLGRKETPSVGRPYKRRPYKGPQLRRAGALSS